MFPYTSMSLNKKNCLGLDFFRHIFVNTPSPTNTLRGAAKGYHLFNISNFYCKNVFENKNN